MKKQFVILVLSGVLFAGCQALNNFLGRTTTTAPEDIEMTEEITNEVDGGAMQSESYSMTGGTDSQTDGTTNKALEEDLNGIQIETDFNVLVE